MFRARNTYVSSTSRNISQIPKHLSKHVPKHFIHVPKHFIHVPKQLILDETLMFRARNTFCFVHCTETLYENLSINSKLSSFTAETLHKHHSRFSSFSLHFHHHFHYKFTISSSLILYIVIHNVIPIIQVYLNSFLSVKSI
jgi:hypothetical protein